MVLSETTGTETIHYLHGLGLVAESDGTGTDYFMQDGLGSVRQLTDPVAGVLLAQTFDPYGNLYARAGAGPSAFGFAGEQQDPSGLLYLRARYYNPAQGRFFQMDPSRQETNPYSYSFNNPINWTDPTGYIACAQETGTAKQQCLDEIEARLSAIDRRALLLELRYPGVGFGPVHKLMHRYLNPRGGERVIN